MLIDAGDHGGTRLMITLLWRSKFGTQTLVWDENFSLGHKT